MEHVYGSPDATYEELAEAAGVKAKTAWGWTRKYPAFNKWLCAVMLVSCRQAVTRVWRAVIARALSGSDRAADMVLKRFDPGYARLMCKYAQHVDDETHAAIDVEVVAAAKRVLEGGQGSEQGGGGGVEGESITTCSPPNRDASQNPPPEQYTEEPT
jgi:hypothetical protein